MLIKDAASGVSLRHVTLQKIKLPRWAATSSSEAMAMATSSTTSSK